VAVARGRITALGGERDVKAEIGPETEVVDLNGRLLSAGFQDAHVHPGFGGLKLLRCNLFDATDAESALATISSYAAAHPDLDWIVGGGWQMAWFAGGVPSAELLDRVVPDRPAFLHNRDGHGIWANSRALRKAGVAQMTPDPSDGRIERLPDGRPQGTLHEGAMRLVEEARPPDTDQEREAGLLKGQQYLLSCGITAWQDAAVLAPDHQAYLRLSERGELRATVIGAQWWDRAQGLSQIDDLLGRATESAPNYRPHTVKLMLDGVAENYTAAMLEPYLGGPNAGLDFIEPGELKEIVTRLDALGLQCHFHAIGDRAVRNALDAVETARQRNGWSDLRHHIAHLQVIHPTDIPRFRRLGVVATAQPLWACHEPQMDQLTIPFLGEERARRQYPFGSLLAAGATMAMGSDWSVSTAEVPPQIEVAVNRISPESRDAPPFLPEQRLTLAAALVACTAGSAYANQLDDSGTIAAGNRADLTVLDRDPFEDPPIGDAKVDLTFIFGELVYDAKS
jgi:hypothetical protein